MGIKAWITVNGNHIPIMDGESKMSAVGRFIKSKRDEDKKKFQKVLDEFSGDRRFTLPEKYDIAKSEVGYNPNAKKLIQGVQGFASKETDERLYKVAQLRYGYKRAEKWKKARETDKDQYKGAKYKLKANYMSQKDIDKAYKKEDYSEVVRNLSRSEKANLKQAYKDLDFYSRGSKGYKNAKSYIDKMEAKAMMSHKSKKK